MEKLVGPERLFSTRPPTGGLDVRWDIVCIVTLNLFVNYSAFILDLTLMTYGFEKNI